MASGPNDIRLLVAFEDEYRAYRGAISSAIGDLRPGVRVETSCTDDLPGRLDRLRPQVVICSLPEGPDTADRASWVELPPEPGRTVRVRLGDRRFELTNPSLWKMLEIVDEAGRLLGRNAESSRQ